MATKGTFYEVTVEFEINNGTNKPKKTKEYYLVAADSVTYAEAQVADILKEDLGDEWVVVSAKKSKVTVVEPVADVTVN